MKARELMIGDWVYCKPHKKNGRVYRLDEANGNGNGWIAVIDGDFYEDRIEPIMITEEILEKNGFIGKGYAIFKIDNHSFLEYYYHEHRFRKVWVGVDEWQNHSEVRDITFQCNCYYVHELQHALRLCGFDKEIIL